MNKHANHKSIDKTILNFIETYHQAIIHVNDPTNAEKAKKAYQHCIQKYTTFLSLLSPTEKQLFIDLYVNEKPKHFTSNLSKSTFYRRKAKLADKTLKILKLNSRIESLKN